MPCASSSRSRGQRRVVLEAVTSVRRRLGLGKLGLGKLQLGCGRNYIVARAKNHNIVKWFLRSCNTLQSQGELGVLSIRFQCFGFRWHQSSCNAPGCSSTKKETADGFKTQVDTHLGDPAGNESKLLDRLGFSGLPGSCEEPLKFRMPTI